MWILLDRNKKVALLCVSLKCLYTGIPRMWIVELLVSILCRCIKLGIVNKKTFRLIQKVLFFNYSL